MADLLVTISGDTKNFSKAIDEIKEKTEDLQGGLEGIAEKAGLSYAAMIALAGIAVHAFAESEKASNTLELSLQNQGIATSDLFSRYKELADELQKKSGIDNDQIVKGESILQNFLGQAEASDELITAMVDLAARTGSVESAAELLGRGIEGNTRGLKQFGIEIDSNADKQQRIAEITEKVTQKFAGLAEVNNSGLGSFQGLKVAVDDFFKAMGERLAPAVTAAVVQLTDFFNTLDENGPLLDFIFEIAKIVATIAGVVTAVATVSLTIIKLQQAFQIAQAAMTAFGAASQIAVGATGLGLLLIVGLEIYENWGKIFPVIESMYHSFVNNVTNLTKALGDILSGLTALDPTKIKQGLDEAKAIMSEGLSNINDLRQEDIQREVVQNDQKKQVATAAAAFEITIEKNKMQALQATRDLNRISEANQSTALIDLKKKEVELLNKLHAERNLAERAAITERLTLNQGEQATELMKMNQFNAQVLAGNEKFMALSEADQKDFVQKHQANLLASYQTEKEAKQAFLAASLKQDVDAHNTFLSEQQKYGTAYATISKAMHSEEFQGTSSAVGNLVGLQKSKNAELKTIGKAAAIADITIKTGQAAMAVFAGFSAIPIVGPILGAIGAAAAIAYGVEQIADVTAAADGGMITGGIPNVDSVHVLAQQGELVVPKQNFDEVVNAVSAQRTGNQTTFEGSGSGMAEIVLTLKDDLVQFIEAKLIERKRLNISLNGA